MLSRAKAGVKTPKIPKWPAFALDCIIVIGMNAL
jgi:hypothetical protein